VAAVVTMTMVGTCLARNFHVPVSWYPLGEILPSWRQVILLSLLKYI